MRTSETLIKLAKHKVDGVQKLMVSAQKIHEDLVRKITDLDKNFEREKALANCNPELAANFNSYVKAWKLQKANVEASIIGVEEQLESLKIDLAEAFEEQKKYETLEEKRQSLLKSQRKSRELKAMDEFTITKMARK